MNLIDLYVTKVLSEPEFEYGFWWVKVEAEAYGRTSEHSVYFDKKSDALKVKPGYKFLG